MYYFFDPELTVSHTSVLTILAITVERYYAVKILSLVSFHLNILHIIYKDNVNIFKDIMSIYFSAFVIILSQVCLPLHAGRIWTKGKAGLVTLS